MTFQLIETLRDVLTVMKLTEEVKLDVATKEKINKVCAEYLDELLPKSGEAES